MAGKGTTVQRGYGAYHKKLRRNWEPIVRAGRATCWRCGEPIAADGAWDLGHDDLDRTQYRGPEHVGCNRATAGRREPMWGPPVDTSREW
ncbi:hypothetical protein D2E49_04350 [Mycobacteroides abscessus]|uniref:hypothetical protein n=1 Tax=Mycobacteroides abscessus TaxID=36809 RepID=UPI00094102B9|nr:hypothetical protein [Mycobacteroides abscessus]MBN7419585.1 hypothetical protein [Mycobacteroides abscessus subsp. massiliense]MDM2160787.1 hypothetical protein [Mycobacteroides abscessus]MDM2171525.1 hypothetical protein [Mycobacteroides abscessus]MDM2178588.1 hypothetical protein [Mycobacteroides abscessus]MDM2207585.1 hypothetical protein [Mycobacteroides abscessus]